MAISAQDSPPSAAAHATVVQVLSSATETDTETL
jgi:hypothetical protein